MLGGWTTNNANGDVGAGKRSLSMRQFILSKSVIIKEMFHVEQSEGLRVIDEWLCSLKRLFEIFLWTVYPAMASDSLRPQLRQRWSNLSGSTHWGKIAAVVGCVISPWIFNSRLAPYHEKVKLPEAKIPCNPCFSVSTRYSKFCNHQ